MLTCCLTAMQLLFTCCCVKDTAFLPFFPPGISRFRHFCQKRCCCCCCRSCCTAGTAVVMVAAAVAVTAAVAVAAAVAGGQCPSRLLLRLFLLRVLLPAPAPAPSCSPLPADPPPPPKKNSDPFQTYSPQGRPSPAAHLPSTCSELALGLHLSVCLFTPFSDVAKEDLHHRSPPARRPEIVARAPLLCPLPQPLPLPLPQWP